MTLRQSINKIKKIFGTQAEYKIKINFHYFSGFIKIDNKILYVSSFDERHNKDYESKILIRTAKDFKDFSGGMNNFFNINSENTTKEKIINILYREV